MSLTTMGKDAETVRFLDDIDFTFSLDSRSAGTHQMTSIEVSSQPIVFRASYRDINLITTIVNRAMELYGESTQKRSISGSTQAGDLSSAVARYRPSASRKISKATTRSAPVGNANVVLSKEQVTYSVTSTRVVLILQTPSSAHHVKASVLFSSEICTSSQCSI